MSSQKVTELFQQYKQQADFTNRDDENLANEILIKLKNLLIRHEKITKLSKEISSDLALENVEILKKSKMEKIISNIIRRHFPPESKPPVRGISFAFGTDMHQATEKELELDEMVRMSYHDMFRIIDICEIAFSRKLKFKSRGVSVTTNQLIKHPGTKNGATITRDSLVISNEGPIIKGSRQMNQTPLKGENRSKGVQFGKYAGEYREFITKLTDKIKERLI